MTWRVGGIVTAATILVVAAVAAVTPAASAAATNAPGGVHRYVVSVGRVDPAVRTNWVRLATYSFTAGNEVTESHWHWTQRERVSRSYTGVRAAGCGARDCVVQTGNGFQSTSAPEHLRGTYAVTGDILRITWDGGIWEEWTVSQPIAGKLAKLTFRGTSFGATHGFGYGSDAAWSTRASMAQIAAADHDSFVDTYHLWKTDANQVPYVDSGDGAPFWYRDFAVCTGARCAAGRTDKAQYYVSRPSTTSTDRRDTLWHWFTANADGRGEYCYTGNSHVKPLLQIVDSDGGFHGWVGVEASINQSSPAQGTSADDIGVLAIANA